MHEDITNRARALIATMTKTPVRTIKTKTPGAFPDPSEIAAAPEQSETDGGAGAAAALPPDLQAVVDAMVRRALAAERARNGPTASASQEKLPTQAEAMEMLEKDPTRRSVLSVDGYVVRSDGWNPGARG
jgi:hypothetical protein